MWGDPPVHIMSHFNLITAGELPSILGLAFWFAQSSYTNGRYCFCINGTFNSICVLRYFAYLHFRIMTSANRFKAISTFF